MPPDTTPTEDAFLVQVDERLDRIGKKLDTAVKKVDKAAAAVAGAKRRSWVALVGAAVALILAGDGLYLHQQLAATRSASRKNTCAQLNKGAIRSKADVEALLTTAAEGQAQAVARGDRPAPTPEQAAANKALLRRYVERHPDMRLTDAGKVEIALLDCDAFAKNPATAKPQFPKEVSR